MDIRQCITSSFLDNGRTRTATLTHSDLLDMRQASKRKNLFYGQNLVLSLIIKNCNQQYLVWIQKTLPLQTPLLVTAKRKMATFGRKLRQIMATYVDKGERSGDPTELRHARKCSHCDMVVTHDDIIVDIGMNLGYEIGSYILMYNKGKCKLHGNGKRKHSFTGL